MTINPVLQTYDIQFAGIYNSHSDPSAYKICERLLPPVRINFPRTCSYHRPPRHTINPGRQLVRQQVLLVIIILYVYLVIHGIQTLIIVRCATHKYPVQSSRNTGDVRSTAQDNCRSRVSALDWMVDAHSSFWWFRNLSWHGTVGMWRHMRGRLSLSQPHTSPGKSLSVVCLTVVFFPASWLVL